MQSLPHPVETARVLDTRDPFTLGIQFAPEHYLELKCVDPTPLPVSSNRHKPVLQEAITISELEAAARGPLGVRPSHDAVMQRRRLLRYSRRRLQATSRTLLNRDREPQAFRGSFVNLHQMWSSHQQELGRMLQAQRYSLRDLVAHVRKSLPPLSSNPIAHASSQRSKTTTPTPVAEPTVIPSAPEVSHFLFLFLLLSFTDSISSSQVNQSKRWL